MTAADHANTVREALRVGRSAVTRVQMGYRADYFDEALAALDALQTQAETAEEAKRVSSERWQFAREVKDYAGSVEAERDAARKLALERADALFAAQDERDLAVRQRDHARDALRQIAEMTQYDALGSGVDAMQSIARAALGEEPPAADPDLVRHWNPS